MINIILSILLGISSITLLIILFFKERQIIELQMLCEKKEQEKGYIEKILQEKEGFFRAEIDRRDVNEHSMKEAFALLSQEALTHSQKMLLQLAEQNFGKQQEGMHEKEKRLHETVAPLEEKLKRLQEVITHVDKEQKGALEGLKVTIRHLLDSEKELKEQTQQLSQALKAPISRGQWGEIQLRRIIELAGLKEHTDFSMQQTYEYEGVRYRPDLVVKLPGGRYIVIDAKTPFDAHLRAQALEDTTQKEHLLAVKSHVEELSKKSYGDVVDGSIDFIILFLPVESMYVSAIQQDPDLFEWAMEKGVFLASSSTLMPILKAVAYSWRQQNISEQIKEIKILGKGLFESIATFSEHLHDLGKRMKGGVEAYNKALGSLERNFLPKARLFGKLAQQHEELRELEEIEVVPRELLKE